MLGNVLIPETLFDWIKNSRGISEFVFLEGFERRSIWNANIAAGMRRYYETRSKEDQEARNKKHRETIRKMSQRKKKAWYRKVGKNTKRWWTEKTEAEKADIQRRKAAAHKITFAGFSEEKKKLRQQRIQESQWDSKREIVEVDRINDYSGVITMSEYGSL